MVLLVDVAVNNGSGLPGQKLTWDGVTFGGAGWLINVMFTVVVEALHPA